MEFTKQTLPESAPQATLDAQTQMRISPENRLFSGGFKYFWIILGLILVALLIFWLWPRNGASDPAVDLRIESSDTFVSAGQTAFQVVFTNQDKRTLAQASLEMIYPAGISFVSSIPEAQNLSGKEFKLPDLTSGQSAAVVIRASIQGGVGDVKRLGAKVRYKANGGNAVFVKEVFRDITLTESGLALSLVGPEIVGNGTLGSFVVKYKNTTQADLNDLRLNLEIPPTFKVGGSNPPTSAGQGLWILPSLGVGAEGQVEIYGSFSGAPLGGSEVFKATLSKLGQRGEYLVQARGELLVKIESNPLGVGVEVVDKRQTSISAGGRLGLRLKYANNSITPAKNVKVVLRVEGEGVNWSSSKAEGASINAGSIIWSPATLDGLGVLSPGKEGGMQAELKFSDPLVADGEKNLNFRIFTQITSDEYPSGFSGNVLSLPVVTRPQILTRLEYLGGALPPRVGRETTYQVTLSVRNTSNDLADTKVSLRLPFGAKSLSGELEKGVSINSSASSILWNIGTLPAYTGIFSSSLSTTFQLKIVPSEAQANTEPVLISDITLTGLDDFAKKTLTETAKDLTTASVVAGKGRVLK